MSFFNFRKQQPAKSHQDMRTNGKYSVFLGTIDNELKMDEYMMSQFSQDFGFEIYAPDGPEVLAQQETDIDSLLKNFSNMGSSTYKQAAVDLADAKGIKSASCAIVFFNIEYDESMINPKGSNLVHFLGVVS